MPVRGFTPRLSGCIWPDDFAHAIMVINAATRCSSVMTLTCVLWTPTAARRGGRRGA
jgi:hypothetical protein